MHIYQPYTYFLYHKTSKKFYYGAQWGKVANPKNLWNTYFSSSQVVKDLVEKYGKADFLFRIHRVFTNKEDCTKFEYQLLKKWKAGTNSRFLNKHHSMGQIWSRESIEKTRKSHLGKKLSESHKMAISRGNTGKTRKAPRESYIRGGITRKGRICTTETRIKLSNSNMKYRSWKFFRDDEVFIGSLKQWSTKYSYNYGSAATTFCQGKLYNGWNRTRT